MAHVALLVTVMNDRKNNHRNHRAIWTISDINYLESHFKSMPLESIAEYLGRSVSAIEAMAFKLDLGEKKVLKWTAEEQAILKQYYESTMPMDELLRLLPGRKLSAVFSRGRKLGLFRPSRPWSKKELQILHQYYPSEGRDVIHRLPGREFGAIRQKVREFNIRFAGNDRFRVWRDDQLQVLKKHRHEPINVLLQRFPGHNKSSLSSALTRLRKNEANDVSPQADSANRVATKRVPKKSAPVWTDAEKAVLSQHYESTMPTNDILAMLPGRARNSVFAMASTMGLRRPGGWTEEELRILTKYYPTEGIAVASRLPGRSRKTITQKASILDIRFVGNAHFRRWTDEDWQLLRAHQHASLDTLRALFPERNTSSLQHALVRLRKKQGDKTPVRKVLPWTEEEKAILLTHYETSMPVKQILSMLPDRTQASVFAMTKQLGLTRSNDWTEAELVILRRYYPSEGMSVASRLPGRTRNAVQHQACKLKIRFMGSK